MSGLIGAAQPVSIDRRKDVRLEMKGYAQEVHVRVNLLGSFASPWWPPRGNPVLGDMGDVNVTWPVLGFDDPEITSGVNTRYGFVGVTRDVYGSPLGSCVVKLFRTSDDVKIDQITSDPSGAFVLSTPFYPDTHYIVSYKAGSPDVEGTTVNTLIAG